MSALALQELAELQTVMHKDYPHMSPTKKKNFWFSDNTLYKLQRLWNELHRSKREELANVREHAVEFVLNQYDAAKSNMDNAFEKNISQPLRTLHSIMSCAHTLSATCFNQEELRVIKELQRCMYTDYLEQKRFHVKRNVCKVDDIKLFSSSIRIENVDGSPSLDFPTATRPEQCLIAKENIEEGAYITALRADVVCVTLPPGMDHVKGEDTVAVFGQECDKFSKNEKFEIVRRYGFGGMHNNKVLFATVPLSKESTQWAGHLVPDLAWTPKLQKMVDGLDVANPREWNPEFIAGVSRVVNTYFLEGAKISNCRVEVMPRGTAVVRAIKPIPAGTPLSRLHGLDYWIKACYTEKINPGQVNDLIESLLTPERVRAISNLLGRSLSDFNIHKVWSKVRQDF